MRYSVTLDAYLWAKNDNQAKIKAAKIAEFLQTLDDNQAQVVSLEESPFGSLTNRSIHKGKLTLFENKIIES